MSREAACSIEARRETAAEQCKWACEQYFSPVNGSREYACVYAIAIAVEIAEWFSSTGYRKVGTKRKTHRIRVLILTL